MKQKALVGAIGALILPMIMAFAPFNREVSTAVVAEENAKLVKSTVEDLANLSKSYAQTAVDKAAAQNDALKIATTQEAATVSQIATADKNARQMATAAKQAGDLAEQMMNVALDYGATGQGYRACKVKADNQLLGATIDSANANAKLKVKNLDNSPGKMGFDKETVSKNRRDVHNANFCTPEEVDAGSCPTASQVAGSDSNANTLFVSAKPDSQIGAAKDAVRQNILGMPDLQVPASAGQTVTGQAYLFNVNRKTALAAFPAYSLAYLQSMSEVRSDLKDDKGNPISPNDMLFNTVTRYYGSPESKEWAKSLISQRPRGLLVELAKMEGLGAWMDYQEYLANQRIEGNVAAMTLTTALPMEEALDAQYKNLVRTHNAQAISQMAESK